MPVQAVSSRREDRQTPGHVGISACSYIGVQRLGMTQPSLTLALLVAFMLAILAPTPARAAELQPRTSRAYDEYADRARRAFIERASRAPDPTAKLDGPITAGPGRQDGIIGVPGGLVHHWKGTAFIRGVNLHQAIETSRDYSAYPSVYHAVTSARVIEELGDTSRVLMRLHESAGGLSALLEVRSTIQYVHPGPGRTYSIATLDEIREVTNAGTQEEKLLPPGRDSGYLWRGSTVTLLVERNGGVYVEMETLALSRGFPPMLGWIVEPIARRVGRRSVETSLREFEAAVLKRNRLRSGGTSRRHFTYKEAAAPTPAPNTTSAK
jgi:hypothetical protein